MRCLLVALALLTLPAQAAAQELWHGAYSGMTEAQVRKLFPDTTADPPATDDPTPSSLSTRSVRVAGYPALVKFVFVSHALNGVIVNIGGSDGPDVLSNLSAGQIFGQLKKQYGEPIQCKDASALEKICSWIEGKLTIILVEQLASGPDATKGADVIVGYTLSSPGDNL